MGLNENKRKEKDMETKNTYQTTNLYQAAWFLLNNIPLVKIDRSNPKRAIFHFEDKNCEGLIKEFWEAEIKMDKKTHGQLQGYISKIQDIKAMLYAEKGPMKYKEEELEE